MSTKQTQNYGLHLWEPEDKFLRTEFNENSTKLDTALKAHDTRMDNLANTIAQKSAFIKLLELSANAQTASPLSFDISSIQWEQWFHVYVVFEMKGRGYANVRFNDTSGTYSTGSSSVTGGFANIGMDSIGSCYVLKFYPIFNASRNVRAMAIFPSYTTGAPYGSLPFSDVTTLDLLTTHTDYYFSPGGKIRFYGVK